MNREYATQSSVTLKSRFQENLSIPPVLFDKVKFSSRDIVNNLT